MSITSEINRSAEFTTDGIETDFDFDLLIHADTEIQVWYQVTGGDYVQLTLDTHYTVVFTEDGGTVTTIGGDSPYAAGKILIIRHLPITQLTNWLYNDNHTGQTHQDDFDRSVMRDLQIQEQLDRCLGFAIHSGTFGIEFPEPVADNLIGWNAAGDALENKDDVTGLMSLPPADGNFTVGDGTEWVVESGNTARTSLGLGASDSPTFLGLTIGSATAHDPTLTFASEGVDGTIHWEDVGDFFEISSDVNIDGFLVADGLYVGGAPFINFGGDNDLLFAADTYSWYLGGVLEYSFSATEFDAQSNDITTTGTGTFGDLTLSGLTPGSVLFAGAGGAISQDNDNFFFDNANNTFRTKRILAGGVC